MNKQICHHKDRVAPSSCNHSQCFINWKAEQQDFLRATLLQNTNISKRENKASKIRQGAQDMIDMKKISNDLWNKPIKE